MGVWKKNNVLPVTKPNCYGGVVSGVTDSMLQMQVGCLELWNLEDLGRVFCSRFERSFAFPYYSWVTWVEWRAPERDRRKA